MGSVAETNKKCGSPTKAVRTDMKVACISHPHYNTERIKT